MRNEYDVNSLAVPRRAKEAIGALALLKNEQTGHQVGQQASPICDRSAALAVRPEWCITQHYVQQSCRCSALQMCDAGVLQDT